LISDDSEDEADRKVLRGMNEAFENLSLLLYALSFLTLRDIQESPKLELAVNLLYDVFATAAFDKVDPWFIE
jgi:hypothetical protein